MARRKPYPSRPLKPFRIGTIAWNLLNVAKHVGAGFPPVPDSLVRIHYLRYWELLKSEGYLLKELPPSADSWDGELWSSDLSPEGYRFAQYSHDRWIGRLLKFKDTSSEFGYLAKWHDKFKKLPSAAFVADA